MSGVRLASLGVDHLLGVSVVGRDAENVASLLACLVDGLDSLVSGVDGLDGCIVDTSVADLSFSIDLHCTHHVRRSKVAHDKVKLVRLYDLGDLVGNSLHTHLGLLVVGGDLGRGDHDALLALVLLLNTAVEEEGDVGVLFGFCNELLTSL